MTERLADGIILGTPHRVHGGVCDTSKRGWRPSGGFVERDSLGRRNGRARRWWVFLCPGEHCIGRLLVREDVMVTALVTAMRERTAAETAPPPSPQPQTEAVEALPDPVAVVDHALDGPWIVAQVYAPESHAHLEPGARLYSAAALSERSTRA